MPEEKFETNLMRIIAAELWVSLSLQGAVAMFGKSYAILSPAEKTAVDQWIFGQVAGNYQAITPQWLQAQTSQQPVGFQAPAARADQKS